MSVATASRILLSDAEAVEIVRAHLENVRESGNQISSRCPFHPTAHPRQTPFSMEKATGRSKCWSPKCGWVGNAQTVVRELGLSPVGRSQPKATVVDWGLPLRQYGIVVDDHGARFPVFDHEGKRHRDHVRRHQGEPRFYFAPPKNGATYPALADWKLVREWGENSGIVHLCEGNRDWLVLVAHGWPAVGLLGIERWQQAREQVFPHLRAVGIGAVVIVADCDEVGQHAAKRWTRELLSDGYTVGIKPLPDVANGKRVKDVFDLYSVVGERFAAHFDGLPVIWKEPTAAVARPERILACPATESDLLAEILR